MGPKETFSRLAKTRYHGEVTEQDRQNDIQKSRSRTGETRLETNTLEEKGRAAAMGHVEQQRELLGCLNLQRQYSVMLLAQPLAAFISLLVCQGSWLQRAVGLVCPGEAQSAPLDTWLQIRTKLVHGPFLHR